MQYDTTGSATANETRSLLMMLGLIAGAAIIIWGLMPTAPQHLAPIASATMPSTAPGEPIASEGTLRDGVTRRDNDLTIVKAGGNVIRIYRSDANVWPARTFDPDDKVAAENWLLGNVIPAIIRNPRAAERYEAVNAVEKLKTLDVRPPQLTLAERAKLRDLFLVAEEAKGANREKADQMLQAAVAAMPVPPEQQKAFDAAIAQAKTILTPEQLHWIRIGGRPPTPATKPATRPAHKASTRPATRPAASPQ